MASKKNASLMLNYGWWSKPHATIDDYDNDIKLADNDIQYEDEEAKSINKEISPTSEPHAYISSVFTVRVGPDRQRVMVHRGILSQSPVLDSKCKDVSRRGVFDLPEVDPELFLLAVTYLYTGNYINPAVPSEPAKWAEYSDLQKFRMHVQMYHFAKNYKIERLSKLASQNVEDAKEPNFEDLVHIAKDAYNHLPQDDAWFSKYFRAAIQRGLDTDPKLLSQPWMLRIIENGGRVAKDLFSTLTENIDTVLATPKLITTELPQRAEDTPCPNRSEHLAKMGKKGLWRDCKLCKEERPRLLLLGSSVCSFLKSNNDYNDQIESDKTSREKACIDINTVMNDAKKTKKEKKKLARELKRFVRKPEMILLISTVSESLVKENWTADCLFQKEHLRKVGNRWLWEDCHQCLQDRKKIFEKIRQLNLPTETLGIRIGVEAEAEAEQDVVTKTSELDCNTTLKTLDVKTSITERLACDEVTESTTASNLAEYMGKASDNKVSVEVQAEQGIKNEQEVEPGNENVKYADVLSDIDSWSSVSRD